LVRTEPFRLNGAGAGSGLVVVVLLDKTKGMKDAVEDHFILKRRRKKKATQSKSLFTSFYPLLDKEDK